MRWYGSIAASASRSLMTILQMALRPSSREHVLEEVERLAPDRLGLQVVGRLHELGRLTVAAGRDEGLDLDGADRLEGHVLQVGVVDHDVLALGVLEAADRVGAADVLLVVGAPRPHLDARQARLVEQVEAQPGVRLRGQVELDGDGHEPELDRAAPHRASHRVLVSSGPPLATGASGHRREHARGPSTCRRDTRPVLRVTALSSTGRQAAYNPADPSRRERRDSVPVDEVR